MYHNYRGSRISFRNFGNDQSRNGKWSLFCLVIGLAIGLIIGSTVTGLSMHFTNNPVCETVSTASPLETATPTTAMKVEKLEEEIEILKTNQSNLILDLDNCKSTELNLTQGRTQSQEQTNRCNAQLKDVIKEKQDLQKNLDFISPWSEWSKCSKKCWGTKVRTYTCSSNEQIKECNQFPTCPRSGK